MIGLRGCLPAMILGCLALAGESEAAVVFSGSGSGTGGVAISGTAQFDFVQHDFGAGSINAVSVTLTNTAASTTVRGNLITGMFFSLIGNVGKLTTTSAGFDGLAGVVRLSDGTDRFNVDIAPAVSNKAGAVPGSNTDGGYQLSNGQFDESNNDVSFKQFEYGIATVGMGLTGFNGKDLNGDDYGIFAHGSSTSSGGLAAARPLIDGSATFWIARPNTWTTLDQLGSSIRLTFGSNPDNYLAANLVVPPPTPTPPTPTPPTPTPPTPTPPTPTPPTPSPPPEPPAPPPEPTNPPGPTGPTGPTVASDATVPEPSSVLAWIGMIGLATVFAGKRRSAQRLAPAERGN